jgi:hypothetical protein
MAIIGKNIVRDNVQAPAGTTLAGQEFKPVTIDGTVTAATGDNFYGILLEGFDDKYPSVVAIKGVVEAYAAEALSKNDPITGGAGGVAKARLTVSTSGAVTAYDVVRGFALEDIAAGAKGKIYLY